MDDNKQPPSFKTANSCFLCSHLRWSDDLQYEEGVVCALYGINGGRAHMICDDFSDEEIVAVG